MATQLKPVDILLVGYGWTGGILAKELASTGLKILALERGGPRDTSPDFLEPNKDDELRYAVRHDLMQDVTRETLTFRNKTAQTALPMRQLGSFLPGEGVGGAGVHWNGQTWRWHPWDHEARKQTVEKYGEKIIPEGMLLADWGLTYDELEPYYEKFEYTAGVSGKAGHLNGQKVEGGNFFEGSRKKDYPLPPMKTNYAGELFVKAANNLGYHTFSCPSANASQPYVNPDGIAFGQCHYCGFCERFGCEANAKGSAHFTVMPIAAKNPNFELRTHARVLKVNMDSSGKRATGVTYIDARGREFEQPADLVVLSAYALGNVHLMLLSKIGKPYDPATGEGVIGRNYAYQASSGATAFFDEKSYFNPFMSSGAQGMVFDDFNSGNYDFAKMGFIGGGGISCSSSGGGRPIQFHPTPAGTPRWGVDWKKAVKSAYLHTTGVGSMGSVMAHRSNYLDLDPTYRDAYGRPLMRMTFDFQDNEIKLMHGLADICATVAHEMGAKKVETRSSPIPYSIVPYQSTHNTGGAIMGTDPRVSALNKYGQVWDAPNIFVTGACALPQNAGKNPTGPVGALAYWIADALKNKYLKNPGALVPV